MIRIGVIGYDIGGPNMSAISMRTKNLKSFWSAIKAPSASSVLHKEHPSIAFTMDANDILKSPNIDLIAVVTPVWTHYELAKRRLKMASMYS